MPCTCGIQDSELIERALDWLDKLTMNYQERIRHVLIAINIRAEIRSTAGVRLPEGTGDVTLGYERIIRPVSPSGCQHIVRTHGTRIYSRRFGYDRQDLDQGRELLRPKCVRSAHR